MSVHTNKERLAWVLQDKNPGFSDSDIDILLQEIEVHKYLINKNIPWTISWDDAAFSWYENVYNPILRSLDEWAVSKALSHLSRTEQYFAVSKHWYYLLEKDASADAGDAAADLAGAYGKGIGSWISRQMYRHIA